MHLYFHPIRKTEFKVSWRDANEHNDILWVVLLLTYIVK